MNVDMQRLLRMVEEAVSANPKDRSRLLSILRECYVLGVDVLPLDINDSDDVCCIEGERGLRLGFSALFAGREQFVHDIIAERQKKGAFRAFQHLCERIQLVSIPAEFFEKCIRAGAFDSIEESRAALLAGYSKIIAAVAAANAERESNQFSLFAALPAQPRPVPLPKVAAWTAEETIEQENACMGFSFTEYLLTREMPEVSDSGEPEDAERAAPEAVSAPSHASEMSEPAEDIKTPSSLELLAAQEELPEPVDFSENEEEIGDVWLETAADVPPEFSGEIPPDASIEKAIDEQIAPEIVAHEEPDGSIFALALPTAFATAATLRRLRDVLECYPGTTPVVFEFYAGEQFPTHVRVHQDYFVTVSDELRQALLAVVSGGVQA